MYEEVLESAMDYIRTLLHEELLDTVKKKIDEVLPKIKKDMIPTIKKFVKDLLSSKSTTAMAVDSLTLPELLQVARKNIVAGANGFVVFRAEKDGKCFVYLANCKDRELLDETINKYVIIQADSLSKEVEELFGETDLIILQ